MTSRIDWDSKKEAWINLVEELCSTIKTWTEEQGWIAHQDEKIITEEHIGSYTVPILIIQSSQGRVHVDPIGRNIIGAEGRVDICSFPMLNRMLIVRLKNKWIIKTDSLIDWPEPWNKKTFIDIVKALTVN